MSDEQGAWEQYASEREQWAGEVQALHAWAEKAEAIARDLKQQSLDRGALLADAIERAEKAEAERDAVCRMVDQAEARYDKARAEVERLRAALERENDTNRAAECRIGALVSERTRERDEARAEVERLRAFADEVRAADVECYSWDTMGERVADACAALRIKEEEVGDGQGE